MKSEFPTSFLVLTVAAPQYTRPNVRCYLCSVLKKASIFLEMDTVAGRSFLSVCHSLRCIAASLTTAESALKVLAQSLVLEWSECRAVIVVLWVFRCRCSRGPSQSEKALIKVTENRVARCV